MMKIIVLLLLLCGCATYKHVEKFEDGEMVSYETKIFTLGTNTVETVATVSREAASVTGVGISDNMRGVIGDEAVSKAAAAALPLVVP